MSHPNIIELKCVYEGDNHIYCVNDYYSGVSLLEHLVKTGVPSMSNAILITEQILDALAYLDSMNIIHRDIKPENILFKKENDSIMVGIIDFGFATRVNE